MGMTRQCLELLNQAFVIGNEFTLELPVFIFCIIGSQHDHHQIRIEVQGIRKSACFLIGLIPLVEQRMTAHSVVAHIPVLPKHSLELGGIGIKANIHRSYSLGDAIPDARNADRPLMVRLDHRRICLCPQKNG